MICRCDWVTDDPVYIKYHDEEWGVPVYDDIKLFEMLTLEGAQAGLSWITVLKKRDNYRRAFEGFDIEKISKYDDNKVNRLISDNGIIRNRLKIKSVVMNARSFLEVRSEFGTFSSYIWQFVGGTQIKNKWTSIKDIPAKSKESEAMSKDLLKRGFKFVGPTICYSFMQAVGMVNDHTINCFRYNAVDS